jgi:hypothetical protein
VGFEPTLRPSDRQRLSKDSANDRLCHLGHSRGRAHGTSPAIALGSGPRDSFRSQAITGDRCRAVSSRVPDPMQADGLPCRRGRGPGRSPGRGRPRFRVDGEFPSDLLDAGPIAPAKPLPPDPKTERGGQRGSGRALWEGLAPAKVVRTQLRVRLLTGLPLGTRDPPSLASGNEWPPGVGGPPSRVAKDGNSWHSSTDPS